MSILYPYATKVCIRCGWEKPYWDFGPYPFTADKLRRECKQCRTKLIPLVQHPLFPLSKMCYTCKTVYDDPFSAFEASPHTKDGMRYSCRKCVLETRERYSQSEKARRKKPGWSTQVEKKRIRRNQRKVIENERQRLRYATDPDYVIRVAHNRKRYEKNHPAKMLEKRHRYVARQQEVTIDPVDYTRVIEQHGYWCYICTTAIDPLATDRRRKLTYDHVVPLKPRKGEPKGTHTPENIRPAHGACNYRKGNRPFHTLTAFDRRGP